MNRYKVWRQEDRENTTTIIEALDSADAAEKWAKEDDQRSAEYSIVNGQEVVVCVSGMEDDAYETYEVVGEPVPYYYSRLLPKEAQ